MLCCRKALKDVGADTASEEFVEGASIHLKYILIHLQFQRETPFAYVLWIRVL